MAETIPRSIEKGVRQAESGSPLVSIIIPCWNGERFVGEAIESALAQTYPNVEVVVIDDGSTDASLEVIKSYGDRIRWETGPNRGGSAARNRGIALARGEFVQFLDADDLLYPDKLEVMVPIALAAGTSVIPASDWDHDDGKGTTVRRNLADTAGGDAVLFCLRHPLLIPSPLHRRANLDLVGGFDIALPCSQERDLHLRLVSHGLRLERVAKPFYLVRRQPASVSSNFERILDQREAIFFRVRNLLEARNELTPARRRAIAEALARDGRRYVRLGLDDKADRYFRLARQVDAGGGIGTFGRWYSRALARSVGPARAERLIQAFVNSSTRTSTDSRSGG